MAHGRAKWVLTSGKGDVDQVWIDDDDVVVVVQKLAWRWRPLVVCSCSWAWCSSLTGPCWRWETYVSSSPFCFTCTLLTFTSPLPPISHFATPHANHLSAIAPLPLRPNPNHRPTKDLLLLRAQTETPRDCLFHRRDFVGVLKVAVCGDGGGDVWVFEFVWVSASYCLVWERSVDCEVLSVVVEGLVKCG